MKEYHLLPVANKAAELLGVELDHSMLDLYDDIMHLGIAHHSMELLRVTTFLGPCGVLMGGNGRKVIYRRGETNSQGFLYAHTSERIVLATQLEGQVAVEVVDREEEPYKEQRIIDPYVRDGGLVVPGEYPKDDPRSIVRLEEVIGELLGI